MSGEVNENQYVSYPMFKGLQKPLEFMGFQGRYITWAACAIGGAILGFIIAYCIFGCWAMDENGNLDYIPEENYTEEMWNEQKKLGMRMMQR